MRRVLSMLLIALAVLAIISIDKAYAYYPLGSVIGYAYSAFKDDGGRTYGYIDSWQGFQGKESHDNSISDGLPGVEEEVDKNRKELHRINERRIIHERYS
jgi:hypothetical protein